MGASLENLREKSSLLYRTTLGTRDNVCVVGVPGCTSVVDAYPARTKSSNLSLQDSGRENQESRPLCHT
jgi:hypothetical protein